MFNVLQGDRLFITFYRVPEQHGHVYLVRLYLREELLDPKCLSSQESVCVICFLDLKILLLIFINFFFKKFLLFYNYLFSLLLFSSLSCPSRNYSNFFLFLYSIIFVFVRFIKIYIMDVHRCLRSKNTGRLKKRLVI